MYFNATICVCVCTNRYVENTEFIVEVRWRLLCGAITTMFIITDKTELN